MTSRRAYLALGIFSAALLAALVVASRIATGIVVQADEGSYLLNAAAIAGKLSGSELVYNYYSGYSLLLAPIFLLYAGFDEIYRTALVLNALLVASITFALYRLIALVDPDARRDCRLLAAASATCFAPLLVLSQFTFSDIALASTYAWSLAFGATALTKGSRTAALVCGAMLGFLFVIHARGVALSLPILCTLFAFAFVHREVRRTVTIIWLSALAIGALHVPVEILAGKAAAPGIQHSSAASMFSSLASLSGWAQLALNAGGAAVVAIVGSSGLTVLVAIDACRNFRAAMSKPTAVVPIACLAVLVACILVTALFFNPPARADHVVYGRYLLPAMIPLIALGLARIATAEPRLRALFAALAVGLPLVVLVASAFRLVPHPPVTNWNPITTVELFVPYTLTGSLNWIAVGLWFLLVCSVTLGS